MIRFRCERFPDGVAHIRTPSGAVVDFVDGQATVSEEQAADLRGVPEVFGLVELPPDEPEQGKVTPAKRAARPRKR